MLEFNFSPFPVLTTKRLLLRELSEKDAPELFFLRSDENVLRYIGREPAKSLDEVVTFIGKLKEFQQKNESILWAIALSERPEKLIGTICFWQLQPQNYRAEIGYVLHPGHWGKGIMKEAIEEVVRYGFEVMNLHSIEGRTNPDNIASGKALEKTEFVKEGHLREEFFFNGKFYDSVIYSRVQANTSHVAADR